MRLLKFIFETRKLFLSARTRSAEKNLAVTEKDYPDYNKLVFIRVDIIIFLDARNDCLLTLSILPLRIFSEECIQRLWKLMEGKFPRTFNLHSAQHQQVKDALIYLSNCILRRAFCFVHSRQQGNDVVRFFFLPRAIIYTYTVVELFIVKLLYTRTSTVCYEHSRIDYLCAINTAQRAD